jgi:hypothetical protein
MWCYVLFFLGGMSFGAVWVGLVRPHLTRHYLKVLQASLIVEKTENESLRRYVTLLETAIKTGKSRSDIEKLIS